MKEIATPRLAATVLLVRDRGGLEVLMVERHEKADFASALVFPGGLVDEADSDAAWADHSPGWSALEDQARALRIGAYRELFEETGLLVQGASGAQASHVEPKEGEAFRELVQRLGVHLDLGALRNFAHWITPQMAPRRYDTHFLLCGVPSDMKAVSDGAETVSVEWLRPKDALALGASGERKLLFPTRVNLELLDQQSSVSAALDAAAARTIVTVQPTPVRREDGIYITIPPDAGYGQVHEFVPAPPRSPKPETQA